MNDRFQLGDGTQTWRNAPVQVAGLTGVVAVAAGSQHSLALTADGTVWAWGQGQSGQLGDGNNQVRSAPVPVMGLARAVAIAAGEHCSYAIEGGGVAAGTLWAWGANGVGQLGDGTSTFRFVPIRVAGLPAVRSIAAHHEWAAAILDDGGVRMWGRNSDHQLAEASAQSSERLPIQSPLLGTAAAIATGWRHGFLLGRTDGRVWAWGDNQSGQTGEDSLPFLYATPHPILEIPGWTTAALGHGHSIVADAGGAVWVTGHNAQGQLGDGTTTLRKTAYKLPSFTLANNAWLAGDADNDGLPTWREFLAHTDPLSLDTNGNGVSDGAEVSAARTPDDPDVDGDGSPNWVEAQRGTDPFIADSDGDGINDRLDLFPRDPTRSQLPSPDPNDHTPPVITLIEPTSARPVP